MKQLTEKTNQKFGFKDYQLRNKITIKRFIQLVFSVWAAILFWEMDNPSAKDGSNPRTIGEMIDQVKIQALGETFDYIIIYFNLSVPKGGLLHVLKGLGLKIDKEYNLNNKKLGETWKVQKDNILECKQEI